MSWYTATTQLYTLYLHDALPISRGVQRFATRLEAGEHRLGARELPRDLLHVLGAPAHPDQALLQGGLVAPTNPRGFASLDRKSTRLNSSHGYISYAVFCLKKKSD